MIKFIILLKLFKFISLFLSLIFSFLNNSLLAKAREASITIVITGMFLFSALTVDNNDTNLAVIFVIAYTLPFSKEKYSLFARNK